MKNKVIAYKLFIVTLMLMGTTLVSYGQKAENTSKVNLSKDQIKEKASYKNVARLREAAEQKTPDWVSSIFDEQVNIRLQRAKKNFEETGLWFYCKYEDTDCGTDVWWDEVATARTWEELKVFQGGFETVQLVNHKSANSFNPYKVGYKWYAFYGGHYHVPRGPWPVGLAVADKLSGPWKRIPESTTPVPIVEEFTEIPIISKLNDGRYFAIFDSYENQEIAYNISEDGVNWVPETRLKVQSGTNTWAEDGHHVTRTPLCAIQEDYGTFLLFTPLLCWWMVKGFIQLANVHCHGSKLHDVL